MQIKWKNILFCKKYNINICTYTFRTQTPHLLDERGIKIVKNKHTSNNLQLQPRIPTPNKLWYTKVERDSEIWLTRERVKKKLNCEESEFSNSAVSPAVTSDEENCLWNECESEARVRGVSECVFLVWWRDYTGDEEKKRKGEKSERSWSKGRKERVECV